jgi:hypothetical protein
MGGFGTQLGTMAAAILMVAGLAAQVTGLTKAEEATSIAAILANMTVAEKVG